MRKTRTWMTFACSLFAVSIVAAAQDVKAGLWEIASSTTFQKTGSVGMFNGTQSQNPNSPSGDAQGTPVCLTREIVDKYGVILPPSLRDCELSNIVRKPNSMTADMTCSGRINGKGSLDSAWTDSDHVKGKIHFTDKVKQDANNSLTLTWTQDSSAVFKSADCGDVKPRKIPIK